MNRECVGFVIGELIFFSMLNYFYGCGFVWNEKKIKDLIWEKVYVFLFIW